MILITKSLSEIAFYLLDGFRYPLRFYPEYDLHCRAWKERTGEEVTVKTIYEIAAVYDPAYYRLLNEDKRQ